MPLSDFCNRLTNTCTQHGPSDSRACAVPGEPLAGPALGCDTDPPSVVGPPADPRVERRLTATLQLRPSPTTVRRARAEREPRALASKRAPRGPGGASIGSSSAPCLPVAAFSAANRARDVASGALCRDPRDTATAPSEERAEDCVRRAARPASPRRLVKGSRPRRTRTPSIDDGSLVGIPALPHGIAAVRSRRLAAACTRRLSTDPATLPPRAGHDASSPLCAKQKPLCTRQNRAGRLPSRAWGVGARPMPEGVDPAPLVDFCNQNSPRAQPLISRSPSGAARVAPLRAFRVACRGAGPSRVPRPRAWRARASRASRPASRSLGPSGFPGDTNRGFTGQGPSALGGRRLPMRAPEGARSESFAPTRSARAPPVVGPRRHRLESPAPRRWERAQHVRHAGRTPR